MSKMMKRGLLLASILIFISVATIYYTVDMESLRSLTHVNPLAILLALVCLTIGMYFDGLRLQRLVRIGGYKLSIRAVLTIIFGNYFMALLTPGASGGAVAQVLILKYYGVPVMKGAPIVLIRTVFSILFLIVMLPAIFMVDHIQIPYITRDQLLWFSLSLLVATVLGLWLLRTTLMQRFVYTMAQRVNSHKTKAWLGKLKELNEGMGLLYARPGQSLIVFVESGLSLLFLYGIAPSLMYAFTSYIPLELILGRMILLNLILYFAPTPGGTGIAEGLFVYLFQGFLPAGTVGIVAVAWRVIAEYTPFFIGMYSVFTLYGKRFMAETIDDK